MKIRDYSIKIGISGIILSCLFSSVFAATTKKGREIVNQLEDDGRPDGEIKVAIEDLGYDAEEYLGKNIRPNLTVIKASSDNNSKSLSQEGQNILRQLIEKGRTEDEIKIAIADLGYDPDVYFSNNLGYDGSYTTTYTSRSCKKYNIEYIEGLDAYTSPDLQKKEYFVSIEYLKRYIDSKNKPQANCSTNGGRISTSYRDTSSSSERFIAPNGKIYFISHQDGYYYSSDLTNGKKFSSLSEIKYYIRDRNPLIGMNI